MQIAFYRIERTDGGAWEGRISMIWSSPKYMRPCSLSTASLVLMLGESLDAMAFQLEQQAPRGSKDDFVVTDDITQNISTWLRRLRMGYGQTLKGRSNIAKSVVVQALPRSFALEVLQGKVWNSASCVQLTFS